MELIEQIKDKVESKKFPAQGSTLVVAVSGGVDSTSLLHILLPLSGHYDWRLIVAHLNHGLRRSAVKDAKFVDNLAKSFGLKSVIGYTDVKKLAKHEKMTIEEAARVARYSFLRRVAKQYKAVVIVTAHTADDQVETVIMNWLRGASVRGLAGMKELRDDIWRPLLDVPKKTLQRFAKEYKIDYREDESNKQLNYTRNQVRHLLMPVLLRISPKICRIVLRGSDTFASLEGFLDKQVRDLYKKIIIKSTKKAISFNYNSFIKLHPFIQDELLLYAVNILQGSRQEFKKIHLYEMRKVIESQKKESSKQLPSKLFLIKTYDKIIISCSRPKNL